ncbi:MAG: transporter permease [Gammaproteobacteria bacterium]|jgi:putative hydroxymethylpyrimidine transport system permease protein|nr:transporter permease [Gammaproteobacteria bacterium]
MSMNMKKRHHYRDIIIIILALLSCWELIVKTLRIPLFIFPDPITVFTAFYQNSGVIIGHLRYTLIEMILGFMIGVLLGSLSAVAIAFSPWLRRWLQPILLSTQVLPLFVLAPLLVIWLGYGLNSKIVTTVLMIYFPVTSAFYDGLSRCKAVWLDVAKTMTSSRWPHFWHIRLPAAMPGFASGMRIAAAMAPMGAVIGEWVGASHGLGFLMLNANARMQIPFVFAVLLVLIGISLLFYALINRFIRQAFPWLEETG